jgi:hypothetical protein
MKSLVGMSQIAIAEPKRLPDKNLQNIVGSLFNSHLFDFVQGWVYAVGVGVAGVMALKRPRLE